MTDYLPLPDIVTLLKVGDDFIISARDYITDNTLVGVAFYQSESRMFRKGLIVTPLGGFLGHSENPNCMLITKDKEWILWVIKDIQVHYPLTINKRLYL